MTEVLMQDNCQFGDMLKGEKKKSQFKYELGRFMGEYAVPLPLGNFSLNNKETRRLELWKNCRGMWFDHVEHIEEGQEQNKEWENFWWTVDEDMFTDVMKSKIEELIDEKLNQEFPEEVEIRENQDYDSEEEMTSETEETDDDESETNNANVNNYLDSANMVMNLETPMKIAEEEDSSCGVRQHRLPQCWITFWCKTVPKVPLYSIFWSRCKVCQAFVSFWRNVCCGRYR